MVTYLYVNPDQSKSDPEWYGFWKFFVDYITTSAEGQDLATHAEFGFTKLPQSVIDKNIAQIKLHFKAPAGAKIWTQEFADKTQIYVGAGDYVISGKRKSNAFAKRSALAAALGKNFGTKDTVVDVGLITELKNLETRVKSVASGDGSKQTIVLSGAGTTNPQNYFRTVMEYLTVESKLPVGDVVCFAALVSDFDFMCCRQEQCTVLWVLALATKSLLARRMLHSRTTNLWVKTRNQ